ncbi:2-oxoglutarate dehydrogenase E1 component [Bacillus ectoiniformans]|uniref:2-oxoglutarate dehydrogenase E1 component n=1 Tax=Bacillus ectoiniformans TaxID=1494429 RepID=UPI00195CD1CE|nr:2-oxoglutarate dehydrogenase E1 component [Bacillus ectoiniformans]MBM7647739.1 2-oxoglutarate dehydrogenase E1 component [Bacillus ectoiniformans]
MKMQTGQGNPWSKFFGPNLGYVMEVYEQYVQDPEQVDPELKQMFDQWGAPIVEGQSETGVQAAAAASPDDLRKLFSAVKLADSIRIFGHLAADINPLHDRNKDSRRIELSSYDLTEEDLKGIPVEYICPDAPSYVKNGFDAIQHLKKVYTDKLAFELAQVHDLEEKKWLRSQIESTNYYPTFSNEEKVQLLKRLCEVEGFEKFIHKTFVGQKRFSIEGLDTLVPLLDELIHYSAMNGAETINIGMAHRGRLNVLTHVLGKPYEMIFAEFQHSPSKKVLPQGSMKMTTYGWTGDVKYHLGGDRNYKDEDASNTTRITLANNPSHLEVVSPIVTGYTRAAQENRQKAGVPEQDNASAIAFLIHGDAAFPGQGVVSETFNFSRIKGYQTGGSIHIIANNMIGFTTESYDSRSTRYASDLAKGFEVPIVHVNADDPEACLAAAKMAIEYRSKFGKDFVIDLIGYRRFGHNEMDEPMTTNPTMYQMVKKHPTVRELYADKLDSRGVLPKDEANKLYDENQKKLKDLYETVPKKDDNPDIVMNPPKVVENELPASGTAMDANVLSKINSELLQWPEGFNAFKKLEKILKRRETIFENDGAVDWGHAETLAFASILKEGTPIRLTGQDSQRGTFAHRNLVLHDEKSGEEYIPLHNLDGVTASFDVINSPLTETAVVGYEYGYNVFSPETLVLWEAQFGDFANMAQVMFDQFVSSGRAKWGQKSGLVMLLPHGYEGQGPEHSSARMERFLQSAAENNWTVANLSSTAQYFHILRRQASVLKKEEVRPLVIMTPKSLLRHPLASSKASEFTTGGFNSVVQETRTGSEKEKVERIVMCSGKVSIDLAEQIDKQEESLDWLHVLRVEELYPFPKQDITSILSEYPNVNEVVWLQEEPQNMGAWTYIAPRLRDVAPEGANVRYVGRRRRSSPSEGDAIVHKKEQARILNAVLTRS